MQNLKRIYQNLAVSLGLVAALAGSYACGSDEPTQNPNGDEIVSVDSGHSQDGGLEDVLNTPDANGADVNLTDVQYTDVEIVDTLDGGYDACVGCDTDSTDTFDGGYDAADIGGDVDLTDTYDAGPDVGGDVDVTDGGGNLAPVVIIETKDEQGNIKDTFNVGEWITYDLSKTYDPDCTVKNSCGSSKGMDYCEWEIPNVGSGRITLSKGSYKKEQHYTIPGDVKFTATCYDLDDKLSTTNEKIVTITQ